MNLLLEFAGVAAPAIAGLLTVPLLQGIKAIAAPVRKLPAAAKQLAAVGIAFGLTKAGAALNVALPLTLEGFTGSDVESLAAAGIAMAVHAGKKARENAPRGLQ